jgi:chromosome segregation ATPase
MNDELTNKILEHDGIKLREETGSTSNIICVKCNYINKLESKYCERTGCAYPLTQEAFEAIKKQEESRMNSMIDERLRGKDEEIQALKTRNRVIDEQTGAWSVQMESKDKDMNELKERMDKMGDVIMHLDSNVNFYKNQFKAYFSEFGARSLTKEERERTEEFLERIENSPDDNYNNDN